MSFFESYSKRENFRVSDFNTGENKWVRKNFEKLKQFEDEQIVEVKINEEQSGVPYDVVSFNFLLLNKEIKNMRV